MKTIQKKKEFWYKIVYLIFTTLLAATILVALATSKMLVSKFVSLDDERQVSVYFTILDHFLNSNDHTHNTTDYTKYHNNNVLYNYSYRIGVFVQDDVKYAW